jgi:hypothetical protein
MAPYQEEQRREKELQREARAGRQLEAREAQQAERAAATASRRQDSDDQATLQQCWSSVQKLLDRVERAEGRRVAAELVRW